MKMHMLTRALGLALVLAVAAPAFARDQRDERAEALASGKFATREWTAIVP